MLLQGVWALQPNINWYCWYPVVEWGVALYVNTKAPRWGGLLDFWSFGSVLNKFCNMQLSCLHGELPWGLYGIVVDCSTP